MRRWVDERMTKWRTKAFSRRRTDNTYAWKHVCELWIERIQTVFFHSVSVTSHSHTKTQLWRQEDWNSNCCCTRGDVCCVRAVRVQWVRTHLLVIRTWICWHSCISFNFVRAPCLHQQAAWFGNVVIWIVLCTSLSPAWARLVLF